MDQWLPWIMALSNMLQAGARSTDPKSGDLGYVWGKGLEGYLGGKSAMSDAEFRREKHAMDLQEAEQRKEYNAMMRGHYETQARDLELREKQRLDKLRQSQDMQDLIKTRYGGASPEPTPMRVSYTEPHPSLSGAMDYSLADQSTELPSLADSSEDTARQSEQDLLGNFVRGRTDSFQTALANLAALDPEAAARYSVMWEMGHMKPYSQIVGYDPSGLPQVQQVLIDPVKGNLVPLGPAITRTGSAPYWAQPGVVPPAVQQRGFMRDANEIPNAKAPPAPRVEKEAKERDLTPAQKANQASIKKQREIIYGSWGKLPYSQLTEEQRKQLDKAYGTRLGEHDPENDEYLKRMAQNQESRRREGRLRYYQNMLRLAPNESAKKKILDDARKEGLRL